MFESIIPGAITLTLKLSFAYVAAADLANPSIPDLAAEIASWLDKPFDPAIDEKNIAVFNKS